MPKTKPVYRQGTEPLTYDWNGHTHEMQQPDLDDYEVAGQVRMLMRDQLDHERICTLARDRIMALSKEIVRLQVLLGEQNPSRQVIRARQREFNKSVRR